MLDGRNVAINPENVTECFGGESTTRICFCDGSYTDVEESFANTVKKLDAVGSAKIQCTSSSYHEGK